MKTYMSVRKIHVGRHDSLKIFIFIIENVAGALKRKEIKSNEKGRNNHGGDMVHEPKTKQSY